MIIEEIKNIKEAEKDLKKFGITVGTVLILVAAILFWKQKDGYIYFGIIGILLVLAGLIKPLILKLLNKAWMILAILMGWVMTRVILIILFYIVVTPTAFIAKIFKKSFLDLKIDKSRNTYWEIRKKKQLQPEDYEKQF
ncbi:MAG: SxtJ family membrane protein [Ignavibacteriaceae bacterium]